MNQALNNSPKLSYRAEIDGLRAIAVISVILYHAQIILFGKDWFNGGFIGVDIFFVISGYLITRIILSELYEKRVFNFLNFYERRARRILPVLFLVIFVSIPYAWQGLLPSDFVEYAKSIIASIFFYSNFFFYLSTTEYGTDSALLKLFLHTWSLGVEEQFYLIFPVFALIGFKYFRAYFLTVLVALSLLSLLFAGLMEVKNPDLNFYFPFSRFWELATGSVLAIRELNCNIVRDTFLAKLLSIIGLCLVVCSILLLDDLMPHPSVYTIISMLGVAFIIEFSSKDELVGQILGSRLFVWIGLISYSAYLWHFPIFAISRNTSLTQSNYDKFEWIALTFLLSLISYFGVERIYRNRSVISAKMLWSSLAIATMISLLVCFSIITGYFVNNKATEITYFLDNRVFGAEYRSFEKNYDYSVKPDGRESFLVVGNSHAEDLLKVMSLSYLNEKYRLNLLSPIKRKYDINYRISCFYDFLMKGSTICNNEEYAPNINQQYVDADVVLLASRWHDPEDLIVMPDLLRKLVADKKRVIVVSNTPESETFGDKGLNRFDAFLFENRRLPSNEELIDLERKFYKDYIKNQNAVNHELKSLVIATESPLVQFADRSDFMCQKSEKRCFLFFAESSAKTLWDYGHTTTKGAKELARYIDATQWLSNLLIHSSE